MIVRLAKTLCGLRQSSRVFKTFLVSELKEYGLKQLRGDPCTCRLRDKRNPSKIKMMLAVRIDDIIFAASDADYDALIRFLRKSSPANNLGELTYYMGCVLERNWDKGTLISVRQHASADW